MTQPPDDRRRMPWEPETPDAADQPTVQWSPPASSEGAGEGTGATAPDAPDVSAAPAAPDAPDRAADDTAPAPVGDAAPDAVAADDAAPADSAVSTDSGAPTGPLLSSTPSTPTVGWQQPAAPTPVVGWQVQDAGAEPAPVAGYVIAGPWARLVAWFIDSLLVGLIPSILSLFVIDWRPIFEAIIEQARNQSSTMITPVLPVTTETVLVSIIGVGLSYLYFVGFWTGPWMATPGMRLLRMRVGDEHLGATLSLTAATKRWLMMGAWLALLAFVAPLVNLAGLGMQLVQVLLFISVIVNSRRQGLHDRVAGSIVAREQGSGDGAVVMGCATLVALSVVMAIVFGAIFFNVVVPTIEPLLDELRDLR